MYVQGHACMYMHVLVYTWLYHVHTCMYHFAKSCHWYRIPEAVPWRASCAIGPRPASVPALLRGLAGNPKEGACTRPPWQAGLVLSRRIAEQGLVIRRFGQNERLDDLAIRRFGYCGWSAQPALLAVWPAVPRNRKLCASTGLLLCACCAKQGRLTCLTQLSHAAQTPACYRGKHLCLNFSSSKLELVSVLASH